MALPQTLHILTVTLATRLVTIAVTQDLQVIVVHMVERRRYILSAAIAEPH